jgi:hypothetical protein
MIGISWSSSWSGMNRGTRSGGTPVPATDELIRLIRFYDGPTPAAMLDLIGRFVYDTAIFGDEVAAIAADRVGVANQPDIPSLAPADACEASAQGLPHRVE